MLLCLLVRSPAATVVAVTGGGHVRRGHGTSYGLTEWSVTVLHVMLASLIGVSVASSGSLPLSLPRRGVSSAVVGLASNHSASVCEQFGVGYVGCTVCGMSGEVRGNYENLR